MYSLFVVMVGVWIVVNVVSVRGGLGVSVGGVGGVGGCTCCCMMGWV